MNKEIITVDDNEIEKIKIHHSEHSIVEGNELAWPNQQKNHRKFLYLPKNRNPQKGFIFLRWNRNIKKKNCILPKQKF